MRVFVRGVSVYCDAHVILLGLLREYNGARPMPSRLAFMLRALRHRNYRLFFGGQVVSLTGSWITLTATSWLVYRLTGSALALGVVGFAGQFPGFITGAFAGAYIDRWDRHKLLLWTQGISMVQSLSEAPSVTTHCNVNGWSVVRSQSTGTYLVSRVAAVLLL